MAKYVRSLDCRNVVSIDITASAAIAAGDIVSVASGKVLPLAAAATAVIGVAAGAAASGAKCQVNLINDMAVIRVPYRGTTKTALAETDRFVSKFDWDATNKAINLDDTTGGMFLVVGYDNVAKTADVVVARSALWNA